MEAGPQMLWEENERFHRMRVRVVVSAVTLLTLALTARYLWEQDWPGLFWLAEVVGGVAAGSLVWTLLVLGVRALITAIDDLERSPAGACTGARGEV